jgi:hypothetical protein
MKTLIRVRYRSEWSSKFQEDHSIREVTNGLLETTFEETSADVKMLFDAQTHAINSPSGIVTTWFEIKRVFTQTEFEGANFYTLNVIKARPENLDKEQTGYDDANACTVCGVGRRQVTPLVVNIPTSIRSSVICLSNGAWIARKEAAMFLQASLSRDLSFVPVFDTISLLRDWIKKAQITEMTALDHLADTDQTPEELRETSWFQLLPRAKDWQIVSPTEVGTYPFHPETPYSACPHIYGFRQLSKLSVAPLLACTSELGQTENVIGRVAGLWKPRPALVMSKKVANMFLEIPSKDWTVEPVSECAPQL